MIPVIPAMLFLNIAFYEPSALANHKDPVGKTQINQQSDLFEKSIPNWQSYKQELGRERQGYVDNIASNKAVEEIIKTDQAQVSNLENMAAEDLSYLAELEKQKNDPTKDMYIDYNRPLHRRHLDDAKKIAEAQDRLFLNLSKYLKEMDVDCGVLKGDKEIEPEFYMQMEQKPGKDADFKQKFCEERRNIYNCREYLKIRCLSFAEKKTDFRITHSDLPYEVSKASNYTKNINSYLFSTLGDVKASSYSGGGVKNHDITHKALKAIGLGVNRGSYTTKHPSKIEFGIGFHIGPNIKTISRLELAGISYKATILIKLNGKAVFIGPNKEHMRGGSELRLDGWREVSWRGKKKYGFFGGKVTHTTAYPVVNTGVSRIALDYDIAGQSYELQLDLLQPPASNYLKTGSNRLDIKVIGVETSHLRFALNASERICLKWSKDEWEERCTLK